MWTNYESNEMLSKLNCRDVKRKGKENDILTNKSMTKFHPDSNLEQQDQKIKKTCTIVKCSGRQTITPKYK